MHRRSFILAALGAVAAGTVADRLVFEGGHDPTRRYGNVTLRRRKAPSDSPNVLFIAIDDMNDWVGFLNNHPGTRTPNLDALARRSVVFENAYCAAPICLAARSAVMFGKAPYRTGVYVNSGPSRVAYNEMRARTPSLVDDMWAAGYDVFGAGKVFHGYERPRWTASRAAPFYRSASEIDSANQATIPNNPHWISPYDGKPIGDGGSFPAHMPDFGPTGYPPSKEPDGGTVAWVNGKIDNHHSRPFFLAAGIGTPHEPWRVPKQFFDMHPLEDVRLPPWRADDLDDLGSQAHAFIDPLNIFRRVRADDLWRPVIQAYQAAISFADYSVGRILNELASSRYADNTIVMLWSDNAYHMGEKSHLEKMTLWERATHVPFLLHVPGRFDRETRFTPPVSTLDVGPTVTELCGVTPHDGQDARSLLPLLRDPALADARPAIMAERVGNFAIRRGPWRYIRYVTGERELYDHRVDPNEFTNIASDPAHQATVRQLDAFVPA